MVKEQLTEQEVLYRYYDKIIDNLQGVTTQAQLVVCRNMQYNHSKRVREVNGAYSRAKDLRITEMIAKLKIRFEGNK